MPLIKNIIFLIIQFLYVKILKIYLNLKYYYCLLKNKITSFKRIQNF